MVRISKKALRRGKSPRKRRVKQYIEHAPNAMIRPPKVGVVLPEELAKIAFVPAKF